MRGLRKQINEIDPNAGVDGQMVISPSSDREDPGVTNGRDHRRDTLRGFRADDCTRPSASSAQLIVSGGTND